MGARLDRLSDDERGVIDRAAVVGRTFRRESSSAIVAIFGAAAPSLEPPASGS
jgi:hypothetical protein